MENYELKRLKIKYETWRLNKNGLNSRTIPEKLQEQAVLLSRKFGVLQVIKAAGLSYGQLKKWGSKYPLRMDMAEKVDFIKLNPACEQTRELAITNEQTIATNSVKLLAELKSISGYALKIQTDGMSAENLFLAFMRADQYKKHEDLH